MLDTNCYFCNTVFSQNLTQIQKLLTNIDCQWVFWVFRYFISSIIEQSTSYFTYQLAVTSVQSNFKSQSVCLYFKGHYPLYGISNSPHTAPFVRNNLATITTTSNTFKLSWHNVGLTIHYIVWRGSSHNCYTTYLCVNCQPNHCRFTCLSLLLSNLISFI